MHGLTFIRQINDLIWSEQLLPLHDSRQICGGIQRSPVGFQDNTWRKLFFIAFLCDVHHQRSLTHIGKTICLHLFHHIRDIRLGIALLFPQIKFNI